MKNIKVVIEYDGTTYHGFQRQAGPELPTIQGSVEDALTKLLGRPTQVTGAGRTDAGVHAFGQVINFYTDTSIPLSNFVRALNSLLPDDIVAKEASQVPDEFHATFWAKRKRYRYRIYNATIPSAFERRYSLFVPQPLNVRAMLTACRFLVGEHDFAAFKAAGSSAKTSIRTMYAADLRQSGPLIEIDLEANGFLYNMVRIIAGTLIYIGKNKMRAEEMKQVIESADRTKAGPTAAPHGLSLINVEY